MFRAHVLIVRREKLYYTVSGIITPIGGRPVRRLREDWTECNITLHGFSSLGWITPYHHTSVIWKVYTIQITHRDATHKESVNYELVTNI